MKSIISLFILFISVFTIPAYSQQYRFLQTEMYGMQAYGGYLSNSYNADFTDFSGLVSCDKFTTGSGNGSAFGVQIELPASNSMSITAGMGIHDRSGSLSAMSSFPIRYDASANGFTQVKMNQTITTAMNFLETQFDARYVFVEKYSFALRVVGGLRIGFPIKGTYDQQSTIVSPENAGFIVDNSIVQDRTLSNGSITTFAGVQTGAVFGIEPMIRISPTMHLTSSLLYDIPFSSVLTDASLNISGLRALFGIRYSIRTFAPSPNVP